MLLCRSAVIGFYLFVIVYGKINDSKSLVKIGRNVKVINSGDTNARLFNTSQRKSRFIGISKRKPLQRSDKLFSTPLLRSPKSRKEGDFLITTKKSKIHVSKSLISSNLLKQRFVPFDRQQQLQVEVSASLIEKELPFDFSDDRQKFASFSNNNFSKKKFSDEEIKVSIPSKTNIFKAFKYPQGLQNKPAFCRKCFKFWRSITPSAPNATLLQYCCTSGNGKHEILKEFIRD